MNPFPWDGAALKIIIEEAGGKVTDLFGNERDFTKFGYGILATNAKIHNKLLKIIRENTDPEMIKKMVS
jgi:fructose-1,6-bisphosphatase/inositol monophosphatase family enzyme